jgi:hypothetical protein
MLRSGKTQSIRGEKAACEPIKHEWGGSNAPPNMRVEKAKVDPTARALATGAQLGGIREKSH